jgi:hypothetical protein
MTGIKKTGARVARWFKSLKGKNRTARRWHEHDHQIYNA